MSRSTQLALYTAVAVVMATGGCGQDGSAPATAPDHARRPSTAPSPNSNAIKEESAREKFHRTNRMDGVGRAHNAALAQYARRVEEGKVRGNVCDDIAAFVVQGSFLSPDQNIDAAKLRSILAHISDGGLCGGPVSNANGLLHETALRSTTATLIPELSADANALVSQMDNAVTTTATSSELASALLPVLDAANTLPSAETDVIDAAASVAQSSREYWEATITPDYVLTQSQSINGTYGSCFDRYSDAVTAVNGCMGLYHATLILPTGQRGGYLRPPLRLFLSQSTCNYVNMTETVHQDFVGGVMGAIGGAFAGGIGAVPGAIGGAAYASSAEMMWQMGITSYCRWKQGRAPKPGVT